MTPELHSCKQCKYLRRESESWEMPDIRWWECRKHPEYEQLLSFPFQNTKCSDWVQRDQPARPKFSELLKE